MRFDRPFDRLVVLSEAEGLTALSQVEGQIQNSNDRMFKTPEPVNGSNFRHFRHFRAL